MKPTFSATLVLDRSQPLVPEYCWSTDWFNNYESAYSLLSKFSLLNALNASDLIKLFLRTDSGQRVRQKKRPDINLNDATLFDIDVMARHFKSSPETFRWSFLYPLRHPRDCNAYEILRYCPRCLAGGFHSAIYQWDLLVYCPIHGLPLKVTCRRCNGAIPYRLQSTLFRHPFCCPHCQRCLSTTLERRRRTCIQWSPSQSMQLANVVDTLAIKQQILSYTLDLDRYFSCYEQGHYRLAPAQTGRKKEDYLSFLDEVMAHWRKGAGNQKRMDKSIIWIKHSGFVPEKSPSKRNLRGNNRSPEMSSWDVNDRAFWEILPIYKSLRRFVSRALVDTHRCCVASAANTLDWRVDGAKTIPICPVAYAYLQWRMFWEGVSIPQQLNRHPEHVPFRLLAWLSDTAPVCPSHWPNSAQRWLTHRIFAKDCLNSFYEWLKIARTMYKRQRFTWSRELIKGHQLTYWAAAGRGRRPDVVTLGIECLPLLATSNKVSVLDEATSAHYRWHSDQLSNVEAY